MFSRAYAKNRDTGLARELARDNFLSALNDRELEIRVRERDPSSLDEAVMHATRLEAMGKTITGASPSLSRSPVRHRKEEPRRGRARRYEEEQLVRRLSDLEKKIASSSSSSSPAESEIRARQIVGGRPPERTRRIRSRLKI